jgi:hypothetical protein
MLVLLSTLISMPHMRYKHLTIETMMLLRWRVMKAHISCVQQQLQSTCRLHGQPQKQQQHQHYHQQLQQLKTRNFHHVTTLDDDLSDTANNIMMMMMVNGCIPYKELGK